MNYFKKIWVALLLTTCTVLSAQAAAPQTNFSDPNKTIMVSKQAPQFTITLRSNPSTGYSWFIKKYNPDFIKVIKHKYMPPISQLVGAGGVDVWTFELTPVALTAPHVLKISMLYTRAWVAQQEDQKPVKFTVISY